ncbi:hypothetical protein [Mesobacillus foraminis]|nr:hypothetical protein [Mesobacillus foraminis]
MKTQTEKENSRKGPHRMYEEQNGERETPKRSSSGVMKTKTEEGNPRKGPHRMYEEQNGEREF